MTSSPGRPLRGTPDLKVKTLGEMLKQPLRPREHLLTPWLRQGDSAMIYAPTGCGKSFLATAIALAVAGGGSFLKWTAPKPRRVLFVDGEMPEADTIERARMLLPSIEGCSAEEAGRNLQYMARQAQHPDTEFPDLAEKEGHDEVLRRARACQADLIILDNFSTLAECQDENAASAFNPIVKFLMRVKQAGIACILVHHSSKAGNNYRGSTKLATTFEVVMGLHRPSTRPDPDTLRFNLVWDKYRGQRDDSTISSTMELNSKLATWQQEASELDVLQEMVVLVQSLQFASQASLAKYLGISPGEASKRRKKAVLTHKLITDHDWDKCLEAAREAPEEQLGTEEF